MENSPGRLWNQADRESQDQPCYSEEARVAWRRLRYFKLMRDAGHIVTLEPGESPNLPCGWPHRAVADDVVVMPGGQNDGSD